MENTPASTLNVDPVSLYILLSHGNLPYVVFLFVVSRVCRNFVPLNDMVAAEECDTEGQVRHLTLKAAWPHIPSFTCLSKWLTGAFMME